MGHVNRNLPKTPTSLVETKDFQVPCQVCKEKLRVRFSRQQIGKSTYTKTDVRDGGLLPIEQVANDEPTLFAMICNACMRSHRPGTASAPAAVTREPSGVVHLDSKPVAEVTQLDLASGKLNYVRRQWRRFKEACLVWLRAARPSDYVPIGVGRKDVDREPHSLGVDSVRSRSVELKESSSVTRPAGES